MKQLKNKIINIKKIKKNVLRIVCVALFATMFYPIVLASNELVMQRTGASTSDQVVRWDDDKQRWIKERSLNLPVAYIDAYILSIDNLGRTGASVTILDSDGQTIIEEIIPTNSGIISLDVLPAGEYTLELRNSFGSYLCGYFSLY